MKIKERQDREVKESWTQVRHDLSDGQTTSMQGGLHLYSYTIKRREEYNGVESARFQYSAENMENELSVL